MLFEVPGDRPRRPHRQRQALAPEPLERRDPEGLVQRLSRPVLVEHVGRNGRYRNPAVASVPAVARIGREASFGSQQLGGLEARQLHREMGHGKLARGELARRDVHVGQACPLALRDGGCQVVVRLPVQNRVLDDRARRDDSHHLPVHDAPRRRGVARLLADRDAIPLLDELREVPFKRVVRYARQRHPRPLPHLPRRQRDLKLPRYEPRVVIERLIEIPHPKQQDLILMLLLDAEILLSRWCGH